MIWPARLAKLVGDASGRERLGARAKAFAQGEFRADNYARRLVDFVQEVQSARPMLGLSDRVGVELSRMGVGPDTWNFSMGSRTKSTNHS